MRDDFFPEVHLVETLDELLDMRAWLGERRDWLGVDIETTGLNLGCDDIRLFQWGDERHGWALPWEWWSGAVRDLLPQYDGRLVYHNSSFDLGFLKREGVHSPQKNNHDTMIMAHIIDPRFAIGLKPASARYVSKIAWLGQDQLKEAYAKGVDERTGERWNWRNIPVDHNAYWLYSAMDTCLTAALAAELWPKVDPEFREVYEVEMACIHVLRDARLRGMKLDMEYVERTRYNLMSSCERLKGMIPVEPSKDAQVKAYLEHLGQEQGRGRMLKDWWPFRTEKGEVSLDDDALEAFEADFPVIAPLRQWRKESRLVSHYFDAMTDMNVNGIIRCSIKQVGARTGRMSITEPALQTLPRGRIVRDAFVAREGHKLILTDFEQVESRVLASYAGCKSMIDAYVRGEDLHKWVASQAYEVPLEEVTPAQRQIAKNVGYANIYGAGEAKVAATAGAPLSVIHDFLVKYDQLFPEVAQFKQQVIRTIKSREGDDDGWVTTILGRRLPVEKGKHFKGVNYLCQASATADVLKKKIVELDAAGLGPYILLPVHDEIICEAPDDMVEEVARTVREVMPEMKLFTCPLTVEQDICMRWGEHYEHDPDKRYHWAPPEEAIT
jgi:DNA polymerase-1